jgi:hypothetical protein
MIDKFTIKDLIYEELILLQEILVQVDLTKSVDVVDQETFNSLYEKVMQS